MLDLGLDHTVLQGYAEEKHLAFLVLFGSTARGRRRQDSDLDLALMPDDYCTILERSDVLELGSHLRRGDVDLVSLPAVSWLLASEVAAEGVLLYEKRAGEFAAYQRAVRRRYADSGVWRQRQVDGLQRVILGGKVVKVDIIREKLATLMVFLEEAREISATSPEAFVTSFRDYHAAERLIELLVEYAADINAEIAAGSGIPASDYYSSFFAASQAGWIPSEVARRLAECASMRNRLVHHYEKTTPRGVYDDLVGSLSAWQQYAEAVLKRVS